VTPTAVIERGVALYDLLVAVLTGGRERRFRARLLDLARVAPGDRVLDVGCGTGTLAIAAAERVGAAGIVHGVDASRAMIARATTKAARRRSAARFDTADAIALPFAEASFDVAFGTLMLHHLRRAARERCVHELLRVVRPGGRVLLVDFEPDPSGRFSLIERLHRRGHVPRAQTEQLLVEAGATVRETGVTGVAGVYYVLGDVPAPGGS
jgi:ubiquinone/menaquinone biosynthesis C-methylase UbiE